VIADVLRNGPTDGKQLNIVNLFLPDVPVGTSEVSVSLYSPPGYPWQYSGDSLILSGVNVSYPCDGRPDSGRVTEGLTALYTFQEGSEAVVQDISGVAPALDLTIDDETAVTWLAGGGLSVDAPTIIRSDGAATKIIDAFKASNEFTIEAWLQPENVTQDGPARIVSVSHDIYYRNFTLAQGLWGDQPSDVFDVRVSTNNPAGMPSLTTPPGAATTELTHVVYTRDTTDEWRIYVDGNEVTRDSRGGIRNLGIWNDTYPLILANERTGNRPWLGDYYLVALYDHALTDVEVHQNFFEGPGIP
ncbi:MAG: LamG domain-containing protein, partial [Chloroflexi bacterium]|nr:LamG domain-containing protein [Chloroflexota bacterium]